MFSFNIASGNNSCTCSPSTLLAATPLTLKLYHQRTKKRKTLAIHRHKNPHPHFCLCSTSLVLRLVPPPHVLTVLFSLLACRLFSFLLFMLLSLQPPRPFSLPLPKLLSLLSFQWCQAHHCSHSHCFYAISHTAFSAATHTAFTATTHTILMAIFHCFHLTHMQKLHCRHLAFSNSLRKVRQNPSRLTYGRKWVWLQLKCPSFRKQLHCTWPAATPINVRRGCGVSCVCGV